MNERMISFLVYSAKCVTGVLAVFLIASMIGYKDIGWPLISVLLVLSADGKDSVPLAITRIKANITGAAVGVLCLAIAPTDMWMICIALVITLALCYVLKLDSGIRSAFAATIIVMLHPEGKHVWNTALERVIAVLSGCLIGLAVTFVFHFKNLSRKPVGNKDQQEA